MRARAGIVLALAAVVAAAIVAALVLGGDGGESGGRGARGPDTARQAELPRLPPVRVARASAFLDSIGVGLHLNYVDTAYGRQAEVIERLRELGVRHIRDAVPVNAPPLSQGLRAATDLGARATLVIDIKIPPRTGVADALREVGPGVEAFEPPNELDTSGLPDWSGRLRAFLPALRMAIRENGVDVPVVGPSFVDVANYRSVAPSGYDMVNVHAYQGGKPPEAPLEEHLRRARELVPRRPIVFTETGYHNALATRSGQPPVSERAAAAYMPRALLWAFAAGVRRTFVYELLDEKPDPQLLDPEQHFGLLRQDLSPKPAFLALRNLIAAVRRSPGTAGRSAVAPTISASEPVERVVLERADGSFAVALWRPAAVWDRSTRRPLDPGRASVRLTWPEAVHDLTEVRPTRGGEPVRSVGSTDRLELELEGDVALVSYH
jgi:hypothetical protein